MNFIDQAIKSLENQDQAQPLLEALNNLTLVQLNDEHVQVVVPNRFKRKVFRDFYKDRLETLFSETSGHQVKVSVSTCKEDGTPGNGVKNTTRAPSTQQGESRQTILPLPDSVISDPEPAPTCSGSTQGSADFSPFSGQSTFTVEETLFNRLSFDSFVVGRCNQLAFSAAQEVAANPGSLYNPLFLYGPTGLGKTHLLIAICNALRAKKKNTKIVYKTSSDFLTEYIQCCQTKSWDDFKRCYYDECDVLLIDDVQFWARRVETQNEFFHIFNHLLAQKKQIVLTCDRPPHELKDVEDRIVSRLQIGLLADIQPPDPQTRTSIIKAKAKELGFTIDPEVINFIAESFPNHVRELEGCVKTLRFWENNLGNKISLGEARKLLSDRVQTPSQSSSMEWLAEQIAAHYRVTTADLKSASRRQVVVLPRQIFWYMSREHLDMDISSIARWSNKDRSTVLSGIRKIKDLLTKDRILPTEIAQFKTRIASRVGAR